jgi:hypothetical protein
MKIIISKEEAYKICPDFAEVQNKITSSARKKGKELVDFEYAIHFSLEIPSYSLEEVINGVEKPLAPARARVMWNLNVKSGRFSASTDLSRENIPATLLDKLLDIDRGIETNKRVRETNIARFDAMTPEQQANLRSETAKLVRNMPGLTVINVAPPVEEYEVAPQVEENTGMRF